MNKLRGIHSYVLLGALFLFSACDLWGPPNNPVDPSGVNYQGYETVSDPNAVKPSVMHSEEIFPKLVVSKLLGAEAYQFQISNGSAFANIIHTSVELDTNEYLPSDCPGLVAETIYYWRFRVKYDGEWSDYSTSISTICV